jgi:hypothetical protein
MARTIAALWKLDRLPNGGEPGVDRGALSKFLDDFLAFGNNPLDRFARLRLRALASHLEDRFKPLHVRTRHNAS